MKSATLPIITFLSLACAAALTQTVLAQCAITTNTGTPATAWDQVFTQNGPGTGLEPAGAAGWTGGDSTYSILLPSGDSAFFFSDSYVGEGPARAGDGTVSATARGLRIRAANCTPPLCDPPASIYRLHNSVVIRHANGTTLTTKVGARDASGFSTSYFKPANPNHFYWMGDSVVLQINSAGKQKLLTFVSEYDNSWTYYGSAIAQLNASTLAIDSIHPLTNVLDAQTNWGTAMWLDGSYGHYYLYIYGLTTVNGRKTPVVALTNPGLGISGVANTNNWLVWNGSGWVTGLNHAASVVPANDSISDEYSVKRLSVGGQKRYVMVGQDTSVPYGTWRDIVVYSSCTPQGPFNARTVVYSTPETGATTVPGMKAPHHLRAGLLTYNPHLHPQLSAPGYLLISYNINWGHASDSGYADGYRPRFIQVPVPGLR